MRGLLTKVLVPISVVCLGLYAYGGTSGITVPDGTYTFKKDPGNAAVGTGQFVGGPPNKMILNPGAGSTRYTQNDSTGKYDRDNNSHQSMCFHTVDGQITWENKVDGVVTSSGHLES